MTFLYFGDAQKELADKWAPVVKQAYDRYPGTVGSVNAGDLVNTSGDDSEWRNWFGAMGDQGHRRPAPVRVGRRREVGRPVDHGQGGR